MRRTNLILRPRLRASEPGVTVRYARKDDRAYPRGAHHGLAESLLTCAFGTMSIGLSPRPPAADRRAASRRIRAASPPTQRLSSPDFARLQSEPPTLQDI